MTFSTYFSPGVSLQGGGSGGGGSASLPISGNGATVTASTPLVSGTQTWNNSGVTFTSLLLNVTDTLSASGSLFMDLQIGASSKFSVNKSGAVNTSSSVTGTGFVVTSGGSSVVQVSPLATYGYHMASGYSVTWGSSATLNGSIDLSLTRRGAANLRFGAADAAAPVAQTLSVQSVVAGTTNTAGANLTITGSQGTGTGAGGSIEFQVAPAGSSGSAQNALASALQITSAKNATFYGSVTATNTSGGSTMQLASTNSSYGYHMARDYPLSWGSGATLDGTVDVLLRRDAANTLALRNGTAAQAFNIYNTYTSGTSYERYSVDWITTANLVIVGPNKGSGGGTQRVQRLSYLEDGGAGSTAPLLGSTCPAASGTVKSWIKVITSDGTTAYVPCWA